MKGGKGGKIAFIVSISSATLCSIFRRGAKSLDSPKVIYPKYNKTQMNLVHSCFWADWAVRAVLKFSTIILK